MKSIDKDRVLKSLEKVQNFRREIVEKDGEVIRTMSRLGFQTAIDNAFGIQTPQIEFDRVNLNLNFLEVPKRISSLEEVMERWRSNLDERSKFREKIYDIQSRYQVSGLHRSTYSLGGQEFGFWRDHDLLNLVELDLPKLREEVQPIAVHFIDYSVFNGLDFYKWEDKSWVESSVDEVSQCIPDFDWVQVWEEISYTSPSIMAKKGIDTPRLAPKYPDDERCHEVNFRFGCGCDQESAGINSVAFCAANDTPRY